MSVFPILYSFRRCPFAMRARMAIQISQQQVEIREVDLKDKPKEFLCSSPKGTVPILVLSDGNVIEESLDIMRWALDKNDPFLWMEKGVDNIDSVNKLIFLNDNDFKTQLDHYKYADRFPNKSKEEYRSEADVFLSELEFRLSLNKYLSGDKIKFVDIAIFPFIRQFSYVDKVWFENSCYKKLSTWLSSITESPLFQTVMQKNPVWKSENRY